MNENPYQPPPGKVSSTSATGVPWYETKPADWEATAAVSWIMAVPVLLWTGFAPLQFRGPGAPSGLPLIPGPEVIGGIAYIGVALVLALLPAAFFALLHLAAMQMSSHKAFRKLLAFAAKLVAIVLTVVLGVVCQFLMIR